MPPLESFRDPESYDAIHGQETCHWTKHSSRLDLDFERKRWGNEGYAVAGDHLRGSLASQ
jgi:antirestriction protein ArdC